jgi:hypothetical protein
MRASGGASCRYLAFFLTPSWHWSWRPRLMHLRQGRSSPNHLVSNRFQCCIVSCKLPQVRCALWQAKQARRAFFLRGREGSLGLLFAGGLLSPLARAGLLSSVDARSIFSSAMMLELSRSKPGPGEGEPSSASGDILKVRGVGVAERAAGCTRVKCDSADSVEGGTQAGRLQSPASRCLDMADPLLWNRSSEPSSGSSRGLRNRPLPCRR